MNMHTDSDEQNYRSIAYTHCRHGHNDLRPVTQWTGTDGTDYHSNFYCQSNAVPPAIGAIRPAWCTGFIMPNHMGQEVVAADLLVVNLHGCSADHALQWFVQNGLAGFTYPTKSDSLISPRCLLAILLDRTVNEQTYGQLWTRLAHEVFGDIPNPAHASCRQRFDYPRTVNGDQKLRSHNGNPLHVDGALSLPSLAGDALGLIFDTHADAINWD